jgi:hypothetical protein
MIIAQVGTLELELIAIKIALEVFEIMGKYAEFWNMGEE